MLGLTSPEICNSILIKTEQSSIFEHYTDIHFEFTFMKLKNQPEEIFNIEDITPEHLQDEKIGPLFIKFHKKLKSEKSSTDGYFLL